MGIQYWIVSRGCYFVGVVWLFVVLYASVVTLIVVLRVSCLVVVHVTCYVMMLVFGYGLYLLKFFVCRFKMFGVFLC